MYFFQRFIILRIIYVCILSTSSSSSSIATKSNLRRRIQTFTTRNETNISSLVSTFTSNQNETLTLHSFNNTTTSNETNVVSSSTNQDETLSLHSFNNTTTNNETNVIAITNHTNLTNQTNEQGPQSTNNETNVIAITNQTLTNQTNEQGQQSTNNETNVIAITNQTNPTNQTNEYGQQSTNKTSVITITNQTNPTNPTNEQEQQSPSKEKKQCTLEAKLAYPYDDPDLAPYKGYHASWLLVYRRSTDQNETDYCDGEHHENIAWCTYFNTGGPSIDSAYIGNVDDYYKKWAAEEDLLYDEIFTIDQSENSTFELIVSHWFFETDYYTDCDEWTDHMFAPILTVNNNGLNASVLDIGDGRSEWTHPVNIDVKTHIEVGNEYVKNPDYQGDFSIVVTCTEECECTASNYTLL